ncbi:uncharacterized protein EV420DRAFT_1731141 [Desarmillaria tabescens]|uniref:F-box domain-containing protein n=1 Tax=Armillaria tabescens TaxID=1929756 RepID=A0AA39JD40_ARMTA|nr:uncharacterized protein EV420DRAFT_1731141 [Desarmillaria tabescens]KAK0440408.1 hypothetical protein EV420DRAFT_1731141 [Desarmillaria tabescens]
MKGAHVPSRHFPARDASNIDSNLLAVLPPVDKLPFELLSSIFGMLSHETRNHLDLNGAPWTVSRVCNKWRHISLNSPMAWSTLNLTDDVRNIYNAHVLLRLFLARSQSSPLHISVCFFTRGCEQVFGEVWKSRSRWESAIIRANYYVDFYSENNLGRDVWRALGVAAELENLRSLQLDIPARIEDKFLEILVSAPLLQSLVLSPHMNPSFPLGTIRSLHCRPSNTADFIKVLRDAKHLTECSFDFNGDLIGLSSPEVTHSGIRKLSTTHASRAFDNVTLSNLEDLSVVYGCGGTGGLEPLVGLVLRSHKPLKRLELKFTFKLGEFLPLLEAAPSLTSLILRRVPLSEVNPILNALTWRDDSSTVVPHLKDVTIDFHDDRTNFWVDSSTE